MKLNAVGRDQMINAGRVADGDTAGDAVNFTSFFQKELCKVGSVLTGDTGDECCFFVILYNPFMILFVYMILPIR